MGKYLQMLDELYQPEENIRIFTCNEMTKPTKALLYPFVSAQDKDIQFFSDPDIPDTHLNIHKEKTLKPYIPELTKPTKDIKEDNKPADHEAAERLINALKLRKDRVFVSHCLKGIYGTKRLELVNAYLEQWQQGGDAEPKEVGKDNAGRYMANVWLRELTTKE